MQIPGTTGGLVTITKNHQHTRYLCKDLVEGKGFVLVGYRFQGRQMAVGNVYLASGIGPSAGIDADILARLLVAIKDLRVP